DDDHRPVVDGGWGRGRRDRETERQRDRETEGQRGEETINRFISPSLRPSVPPSLPLSFPPSPLFVRRRDSRGHVADAALARFFFGGNRMRFDGNSVLVVGLDCVFCPYGRAGRATSVVFEWHTDQKPVIQTA